MAFSLFASSSISWTPLHVLELDLAVSPSSVRPSMTGPARRPSSLSSAMVATFRLLLFQARDARSLHLASYGVTAGVTSRAVLSAANRRRCSSRFCPKPSP